MSDIRIEISGNTIHGVRSAVLPNGAVLHTIFDGIIPPDCSEDNARQRVTTALLAEPL